MDITKLTGAHWAVAAFGFLLLWRFFGPGKSCTLFMVIKPSWRLVWHMRHNKVGKAWALVMVALGLASPFAHAASNSGLGPSRVDFDDRLVKGQRSNSGGIYIFARQSVELKDMVQKPKSYRQRIIKTVFED